MHVTGSSTHLITSGIYFGKLQCFLIGWVPVDKHSKQYCWHSSVVNYEAGIALVLKHHADPGLLEISPVPLSEILEQTLELIGTNINANPYGKFIWSVFGFLVKYFFNFMVFLS